MKKSVILNVFFLFAAIVPLGVLYWIFATSSVAKISQRTENESVSTAVQEPVVEVIQSPFALSSSGIQEHSVLKPNLNNLETEGPNSLEVPVLPETPVLPNPQVGQNTQESPDAGRPSRYGIDLTKPFDPVKENGEIFVDWEMPEVTLVLTGRLNGYMEPCGCAGMDRMTGGLSRQCEFFNQLKEDGWNPLILDVGGISPGVTKQAQLKFLATVNMLREMKYDAITLGTIDLAFPCADVLAEVSNPGYAGQQLFTSANVGLFEFDNKLLPPAKIVSRNGIKIGIVGVLGDEERAQVRNDEVVFRPAKLVLAKLMPTLRSKCQFIVLLSHASIEESKEYAREFPEIDIIVTPNGPPVPPAEPEIIPETGQYFITIGEKGMNVLVLGLYNNDQQPIRYQRVPMDSRFKSSEKILELMGMYQEQLKLEGLDGLGIRPLKNPFTVSHGSYVGAKRCESCHEESYKIWKNSRHAIAWKSLETSKPPRTYDPECIACHVQGWNAEHRLPFASGFTGIEETPDLVNVGCESCHGPGFNHINAEVGSNETLQKKYRKALHLDASNVAETKAICIQCHDLDNSPRFNYERYVKHIEHNEISDDEESEESEDATVSEKSHSTSQTSEHSEISEEPSGKDSVQEEAESEKLPSLLE